MGVIKRVENLCELRCSVSEETLFLPSGDEEEYNYSDHEEERLRRPRRTLRQRPPPVGSTFSSLKNQSGKKKFRRYHNATQLATLAEEDEVQELTIEDFIATSKSPFSILVEDSEYLEKWEELVSGCEEKEQKILEAKAKKKAQFAKQPVITKTLKSLLRKKNLPIGMLHYLEQGLISFFLAQPTKIYVSPVLSSFERLLLHSVSNYHHLSSLSFMSEPEKVKLVRVKNPREEFSSPPLLLVQYLETTYGIHKS